MVEKKIKSYVTEGGGEKSYPTKALHIYFDKHYYHPFLISNMFHDPYTAAAHLITTETFLKRSMVCQINTIRGLEKFLAPGIKTLSKVEGMPWHYENIKCKISKAGKRWYKKRKILNKRLKQK